MISPEARRLIRQRAAEACEYCRLPQWGSLGLRHQVDHIIAHQHGGSDDLSNLCLCCAHCNRKKGPNIASVDPAGADIVIVPLFHPRAQRWHDHFVLTREGLLLGQTSIGRTTVRLLDFNELSRVRLRRALMRGGWRP